MDRQMLLTPGFVRDGKLFLHHREQFDESIASWPNCRAVLRLEEARDPRSLALLAYYWAVCVEQVSEETGDDPKSAHDLLKGLHLPRRLHAMRGGAICWRCARVLDGSTKPLANDEMWRLCSGVHEWAATTLGIVIPDPNQSDVVAA